MLYILPSPVGSLGEVSAQTSEILSKMDVILVEDPRAFENVRQYAGKQFSGMKIEGKVVHVHKDNEFVKLPEIMDLLEADKDVAYLSEAGMPGISDPGQLIVSSARKRGYEVRVIPGGTAFVTAAVTSGFQLKNLLFVGFLPKKESAIMKLLNSFAESSRLLSGLTVVAYESPHRIESTLQLLATKYPDMQIAICRELNKQYEEVIIGRASEVSLNEIKGEFCIVLSI